MRTNARHARVALAVAGVALLLASARGERAWAGGNLQFRNPANLSEVFDRVWDARAGPITWLFSEDGLPGSGIDNSALAAELTAAFDDWEALATSEIDFEFGGEAPFRSAAADGDFGLGVDGRNLVTFTDPDLIFPPGVLAVALVATFPVDTVVDPSNSDLDGDGTPDLPDGVYPAGTIFDGDIAFNSSEAWSVSGLDGSLDIRAVALHEIGHLQGLSHSSIRDAVMWPFLADDIAAARTLKADDIAWSSFYYPTEPAYSTSFGSIRGQVINGTSSVTVLGAHVFAVEPVSGQGVVGTYTADDGSYVIPGLPPGDYLVAMEPLDGDPPGLDPFRINEVVAFTFDTSFPEEFFDLNESNVEADPFAGALLGVSAGLDTTGVNLVTNSVQVPGVNLVLEPGYQLFAYPVEVPTGLGAFELMEALGDETEVHALDRFELEASSFERAQYEGGAPAGVDFPIERGTGYVLHMADQKVVSFTGATDCPDLDLARGLNLIGVPCPPAGYTAFSLLEDLGAPFEVAAVERYDAEAVVYERAEYDGGGAPTGVDFPIANGRGYIVSMLADRAGIAVPASTRAFAPAITGLSPGRGVPGTIVVIQGEGFDPDVTRNVVSFSGVGAGIIFATSTTLTVTVPATATSGPVRVQVGGLFSNAIDFEVLPAVVSEDPDGDTELVSGQTAAGSLDADGEQDRYIFTALAGSVVTASASADTPGVPDLALVLEDPFGVIVATDDNSGGGSDPRINNYRLPTTGTWTVVVTSAPGSGTGGYQLSLTINTQTSPPQVSILGGNYQTAVAGSTLPEPLIVFVTGATGAPVSGSAVTFVATEAIFGSSTAPPTTAGTTLIDTNSSGLVTVQTTLPDSAGQFDITVSVPGAEPVHFTVAATTTPIASVTMIGDGQTGTVGQALAQPLQVVLRDSFGQPVEGGLVAFQVAGGGGAVAPPGAQLTPPNGTASTSFTLGTSASSPHIVAAFVPGQIEPLLFEATPQPDEPATIVSNRSNFNRMSIGSASLSALRVRVFDQHDNPVPGATIDYTPGGNLQVFPGLGPGGVVFPDFNTNADGLHVGLLLANTNVIPTIDEFGSAGHPDLASTYTVTARVTSGSNPQVTYNVDVDMGPNMLTASGQNVSALIGQPLAGPVVKRVYRYERLDTFEDDGTGNDEDNGDFRDEDFLDLVEKRVSGVTIDLEVRREDGNDEADHGLQPTQIDATQVVTGGSGEGSVNVTMGDVGGVNLVIGRIGEIFVEWLFADGSTLDMMTFVDGKRFGESTNTVARPVVIVVDLQDPRSGIDFASVEARLNDASFFSGAVPPTVLPEFPELLQIFVGGQPLTSLNPSLVNDSAFNGIAIHWHPSRPKLLPANTIEVDVEDKVENTLTPTHSEGFSYP